MNVLISSPNSDTHLRVNYLPTIWGVLKRYCDQILLLKQTLNWYEPIYLSLPAKLAIRKIDSTKIDVLGLSCYCWNTKLNYEIASIVKSENPNCFVVAGGPDVDYNQTDFFEKHPFIDAVVLQDGEVPFSQILLELANGGRNFTSIPGLVLPCSIKGKIFTGKTELPQKFEESPLVANEDVFAKIVEECVGGGGKISIAWETDRGCPYNCVFCDWGSNTNSRVRQFDLQRIKQEVDFLGRNKIEQVFITNANFGMFPQDLEVSKLLVAAKVKYGFPKFIFWNIAKNNHLRIIEIAKLMYENKMIESHTISIQSTGKETIASMGRKDLPHEKQRKIIAELKEKDIPLAAQILCGSPGDTLESYKKTFSDLIEWGVHEEFIVYGFQILPNAPANSRSYREQWSIRSEIKYTRSRRRRAFAPEESSSTTEYVTSCKTFTKNDYLDMIMYGRFMIALHNGNITRKVSQYLRFQENISYHDFYTSLYQAFKNGEFGYFSQVFGDCYNHMRDFLYGETPFEEMRFQRYPASILIDVEDSILIEIITLKEEFYTCLSNFVNKQFGVRDQIAEDLFRFCGQCIIDPYYSPKNGRILSRLYDWGVFFESIDRLEAYVKMPLYLPSLKNKALVAIDERIGARLESQFDWLKESGEVDYSKWFQTVIGGEYQRVRRTYLRKFKTLEIPIHVEREEPKIFKEM